MFAVIWRKSITVDEIVMIPSAYYHLVDADFQLVNEHPALPKILAALPLLFVQPNETARDPTSSMTVEDFKWERMNRFWDLNGNKFRSISFWARVPMILLTIGLGILIFLFARTLFGARTAVLAVALFSLEPTILGHGRVVKLMVRQLSAISCSSWHCISTLQRQPGVVLCVWARSGDCTAHKVFHVVGWSSYSLRHFSFFGGEVPGVALFPFRHIIIALTMLVVINAAYYFRLPALTDDDHLWIIRTFDHTLVQ
jgi:hypothetical protein